jgi:hypothetical protein
MVGIHIYRLPSHLTYIAQNTDKEEGGREVARRRVEIHKKRHSVGSEGSHAEEM